MLDHVLTVTEVSPKYEQDSRTMSLPPVDIPLGAMRFNSDSQKLEYWNGSIWMQIHTFSPNLDGGARGVWSGGNDGSNAVDVIDYVTISTQGNAVDFGNLTDSRAYNGGAASNTRGLTIGGLDPSVKDIIDYVTISSTGDAIDFGNLASAIYGVGAAASQTRAISFGGFQTSPSSVPINTIQYVTIASTGDAKDFGDVSTTRNYSGGCASSARAVFGGGTPSASPYPVTNTIEFLTISTLGNGQDFGDLTKGRSTAAAASNATRGIFAGGYNPSPSPATALDIIDFVTLATLGNANDFGDLPSARTSISGCSSSTRMLMGNSYTVNVIEYISIATTGNAIDFGDSTDARFLAASFSNGHGGLG